MLPHSQSDEGRASGWVQRTAGIVCAIAACFGVAGCESQAPAPMPQHSPMPQQSPVPPQPVPTEEPEPIAEEPSMPDMIVSAPQEMSMPPESVFDAPPPSFEEFDSMDPESVAMVAPSLDEPREDEPAFVPQAGAQSSRPESLTRFRERDRPAGEGTTPESAVVRETTGGVVLLNVGEDADAAIQFVVERGTPTPTEVNISPALPKGLTLALASDGKAALVSGRPEARLAETTYVVTAVAKDAKGTIVHSTAKTVKIQIRGRQLRKSD